MIVRKLDVNGDWSFGKGNQSYLYNNQAIALNIKTRVMSFLNDCFFNLGAGIDWFNLLERGRQQDLDKSIRDVVIKSYGVISLNSFDIIEIEDRKIQIVYNISTIYGVLEDEVEV